MSEDNWILKAIEPKSDQLNADSILAGPVTVKILSVKKGTTEQPVALEIDGGHQPYKPCKSMLRVLVAIWGDRPGEWTGRSLTLYCDPDVAFGGMKVGGIRISHMSHIDKAYVLPLTVTRGKRKNYTVEPLLVQSLDRALEAARTAVDLQRLDQIEQHAKSKLQGDDLAKLMAATKQRAKELVE